MSDSTSTVNLTLEDVLSAIENFDGAELKKIKEKSIELIENLHTRKLVKASEDMNSIAKNLGYDSIEEMLEAVKKTAPAAKTKRQTQNAPRKSATPKYYNHVSNPSQTWTGRGKQPIWVTALLEEGYTLTDLLIPAELLASLRKDAQ